MVALASRSLIRFSDGPGSPVAIYSEDECNVRTFRQQHRFWVWQLIAIMIAGQVPLSFASTLVAEVGDSSVQACCDNCAGENDGIPILSPSEEGERPGSDAARDSFDCCSNGCSPGCSRSCCSAALLVKHTQMIGLLERSRAIMLNGMAAPTAEPSKIFHPPKI